ncbi:MAG: DHHA1 domain-containing protein [Paludibaculum sp.]
MKRFQETTDTLHKATSALRTSESEFLDQIDRLLAQQKTLERQIETLKEKVAHAAAAGLESQVREVKGVKVLSAVADGMDRAQMRNLADDFRNRWKSAVILLASGEEGNVAIVTAVTKDLTSKVHAGKLAGSIAQAVGGKGGGRPDMAEAGGKDAAALPAALAAAGATVEGLL